MRLERLYEPDDARQVEALELLLGLSRSARRSHPLDDRRTPGCPKNQIEIGDAREEGRGQVDAMRSPKPVSEGMVDPSSICGGATP